MMGSPSDEKDRRNDEMQHKVKVDGFYIGKYEVTQKQWESVMGNNPSNFKGDNLPVEKVSWDDCQEFIRKINSASGKKFRLPTEAEWEYAARGGQNYVYSGSNNLDNVAWYSDNSGSKTHPVGQKSANGFGIYDMSGNVWELCQDWYDEKYYKSSPENNPRGPESSASRISRGGSWIINGWRCRSANRDSDGPSDRYNFLGFRLVRDN